LRTARELDPLHFHLLALLDAKQARYGGGLPEQIPSG